MEITLCQLADIPDPGAKGFVLDQTRLFAVRKDGTCFVYLNRCPHLGIPLEWDEDGFLDTEQAFIRCSTHGALFQIDNGYCVLGPCRGENLWEIPCRVRQGRLLVNAEDLPAAPVPE